MSTSVYVGAVVDKLRELADELETADDVGDPAGKAFLAALKLGPAVSHCLVWLRRDDDNAGDHGL